ncbi:MAG: flagellar hook-basal body complex protein [Burkholderiales bacterium]|nr:flagellar hook-basal body complex protein [Burkholderiales bacterium]
MGIFGAMITAVAGLRAQSYALENISGNIANSQTTGFKRVDTSFEDLVPNMPLRNQASGSVSAFSRGTNTIDGPLNATGVGTNIALSGEGYIVVRDRADYVGGLPTFTASNLYTRRGDFETDKNGFLVNGVGNYLVGYQVDPLTDSVTGGAPDVLRFTNDQVPAKATTTVVYRANLPAEPSTANADPAVPNSELLTAAGFAVDPRGNAGTVQANEETSFLNQTISGGSVTMFDPLGNAITAQLRWGKSASVASGGTDTWELFYMNNSAATAAQVKWTNAGSNFTFNASGQLSSATSVTIPNMTIDGTNLGPIAFAPGAGGLTQFADISGQYKPTTLNQDGFAAGTLLRLAINDAGRVQAVYSNGQTSSIAQIAVAQFNADNMLKRRDGGTFEETLESGPPLLATTSTSILAGTVEGSNTDIADEFSKMIVTQQAYSANTRVVSTSQQMLQDVLNIIR